MALHPSKENLVKKYEHSLRLKPTEYRNRLSVEFVKWSSSEKGQICSVVGTGLCLGSK